MKLSVLSVVCTTYMCSIAYKGYKECATMSNTVCGTVYSVQYKVCSTVCSVQYKVCSTEFIEFGVKKSVH